MKLSDDITRYANMLYDEGKRGTSDERNGCSSYDEEHLSALFILSTPRWLHPSIEQFDPKGELLDKLARYMKLQSLDNMSDVLDYLVEAAVALHKDKIQKLFDYRKDQDPNYEHERIARRNEIQGNICYREDILS
jgi:hypothetical protein